MNQTGWSNGNQRYTHTLRRFNRERGCNLGLRVEQRLHGAHLGGVVDGGLSVVHLVVVAPNDQQEVYADH